MKKESKSSVDFSVEEKLKRSILSASCILTATLAQHQNPILKLCCFRST